jgi:hypothetical protein
MPYKIKITSLIEMPADIRRGRPAVYAPQIRDMEVGQCFSFPCRQRATCYRMARQAGIRVKTTCKNAPRNKVNVFRVA